MGEIEGAKEGESVGWEKQTGREEVKKNSPNRLKKQAIEVLEVENIRILFSQTHSQSKVGSRMYSSFVGADWVSSQVSVSALLEGWFIDSTGFRDETENTESTWAHLRHHFLEGVHDSRALGLLEVGETASDDDHSSQHHTQIQLKQGEMVQFIWGGGRATLACVKFKKDDILEPQNCGSKLSDTE